jgi:ATP-binding cassette subfamily B protein
MLDALRRIDGNPRPSGVAIDGGPSRIDSIEFRDVTFAYKAGKPCCATSISPSAPARRSRWSARPWRQDDDCRLACRFYEPTSGQILINSVDIASAA